MYFRFPVLDSGLGLVKGLGFIVCSGFRVWGLGVKDVRFRVYATVFGQRTPAL